jgi:hypothetical protein
MYTEVIVSKNIWGPLPVPNFHCFRPNLTTKEMPHLWNYFFKLSYIKLYFKYYFTNSW